MHQGTIGFRALRAVAVIAAGGVLIVGCGNGNKSGSGNLAKEQVLRINIGTEPGTLDPGQQQWVYEAAAGRQYSEALLKPKADLSDTLPAAASSYDVSSDKTVYTFHLRKNAYPDGTPVRAQDFVFAWQRLMDPRLAAPYADFFNSVVKGGEQLSKLDAKTDTAKIDPAIQALGLKAKDDSTFEVTLAQPAVYFKWIATLWNGAPVRKDIIDKAGEKWAAVAASSIPTLQTNGAYHVTEVVPKDHITMELNPKWTGPKPTITKIIEYPIEEANAAFLKYQNGELDITGVPLAQTDAVKADPKLLQQVDKVPALLVYWVHFNNQKPPFDNPKVRLAFAQAIDKKDFVDNVLKGRGIPAQSFMPKGEAGYRPELGKPQDFNAATAKATLASAGVSADAFKNVSFLASNTATGKQIADYLVNAFKVNLGITIQEELIDRKATSKRFRAGDYFLGGPGGWQADYPDEGDWFDIFRTTDGNNFEKQKNSQYDTLVKAADQESDQAKRDAGYKQAEQILIEQAVVAFLYQSTDWYLVKPWVKGYQDNSIEEWPGSFYSNTISIEQH